MLIRIGVDRVLTSGQRATAWEGRETIAKMVRQAAGRIVIMAGGSIDETTAGGIVRDTGVREIHVRGAIARREQVTFHDQPVPFRRPLPEDEEFRSVTDRQDQCDPECAVELSSLPKLSRQSRCQPRPGKVGCSTSGGVTVESSTVAAAAETAS